MNGIYIDIKGDEYITTEGELLASIIKQEGKCFGEKAIACRTCPIRDLMENCPLGRAYNRYNKARKEFATQRYIEKGYSKEDLVSYLI